MRVGTASAVSVVGVEGKPILVEAVLLQGLPSFTIVGLPDAAVTESRERIRAAFASAGVTFPNKRLTVNLSPADVPKTGTAFDLAIAVAIMHAMGGGGTYRECMLMGELGLDGSVRSVRGILPAALTAANLGSTIVVAHGAAAEAEIAQADVRQVWHLSQVARQMGVACGEVPPEPPVSASVSTDDPAVPDMADVRGQGEARHALEVAAAGGHHILMTGPPGVGKSMLAARLPGILPELDRDRAVEVAAIASAAGEFSGSLVLTPPFSSPHHTVSGTALVGGGSIPKPGAISRAHNGVLFLDEMPEFAPRALQTLREPMETGRIQIYRARAAVTFPARFQLVGAANPCRCGNYLDRPRECTCSVRDRRDYLTRIGGPLLDRFDIAVVTPRLSRAELAMSEQSEASAEILARVALARDRARHRLRGTGWSTNAEVSGAWLRRNTRASDGLNRGLDDQLARGELSLRGADKILRISWTLADLAGRDAPSSQDVNVAYALRRRGW